MATSTTLIYPKLPEGFIWNIDRHYNPVAATRFCAIKIVRRRTKKILGITFKYRETYQHSVTYDDNRWIQDEISYLYRRFSS